jgi:integrase
MLQVCKPDGSEITWLHVRREKRGTNPVVRVHPALAMLIEAWRAYLARTAPGVEWMFPGPGGGQGRADFSRVLARAAEGIGSPANRFGETRRTSHALRAYYVEVRRNAGASDLAIAGDLGQGGGDRLIRTTYGAADSFASGRLCWLPTGIPPAWQLLS